MKLKLAWVWSLMLLVFMTATVNAAELQAVVEAENFLKEAGGTSTRPAGRIDASGNVCLVGWISAGHAFEWEVDIPATGQYQIVLRYCNGRAWSTLRDLKIDGSYPAPELQRIELPPTGGFSKEVNDWQNLTLSDRRGQKLLIPLTKGKHRVWMSSLGGSINSDGSANFDSIAFLGQSIDPGLLGKTGVRQTVKPTVANGTRFLDLIFDQVNTTRNIIYRKAQNERGEVQPLPLDLYQPQGDTTAARPAILLIHGGSFQTGTKDDFVGLCSEFARRGFVVAAIDYRLRQNPGANMQATVIDAVTDACMAYQWLRQHSAEYRINQDRIAIAGHSAGGSIALWAAYDPRFGNLGERKTIFCAIDLAGAVTGLQMTKTGPPLLIIHGKIDQTSPYQQAVLLNELAKTNGIETEIFTMEQGGHSLNGPYYPEVVQRMAQFIYRHL